MKIVRPDSQMPLRDEAMTFSVLRDLFIREHRRRRPFLLRWICGRRGCVICDPRNPW